MQKLNCQPDPHTWQRLLEAFGKRGRVDLVYQYIERMKEAGAPVTVRCYNAALMGARTREEVTKAMQDIKDAGLQPDERTLLFAMEGAAKERDLALAETSIL